jgi:5-deoxy-5-amino-3-dehydroquinate synthase
VITVPVELADRSYDVVVGAGARHQLRDVLPARVKRVAVVTQANIPVEVDPGVDRLDLVIGQGEEHKDLASVGELCRRFAQFGLTRSDAVVAVGGGMVTDVAGFAASVYHRGIAVVHVPTTLLGQIDAAIGGKTGVNLPEGKNLVGAFHQPAAVLCDTETLATLPLREYRSGLGEMAKYRFLGADDLLELTLDEQVAACVRIKAAVVAADEREETGRRAILNYGHTLAHALEIATGFELRHGEAVAIGLVYAAELAHGLGLIDRDRVDEHRRTVAAYDLPTSLPPGVSGDELLQLMRRDKKVVDGYTFVLQQPDRSIEQVGGVPADAVAAALSAMDR